MIKWIKLLLSKKESEVPSGNKLVTDNKISTTDTDDMKTVVYGHKLPKRSNKKSKKRKNVKRKIK